VGRDGARDHLVDHCGFGARAHERVGEVGRSPVNDIHNFMARSHGDGPNELVDAGAEHHIAQFRFDPLEQIACVVYRAPRLDRHFGQRQTIVAHATDRLARSVDGVERHPLEIDAGPFETMSREL
jgi:hypothetical protein